MTIIKVPSYLQELFGKRTTLFELLYIFGFAFCSTAVLLCFTSKEWLGLNVFKIGLTTLLMIDIFGGVVANLSYGTNSHYSKSNKERLVFIAIHIQPLLLAIVMPEVTAQLTIIWLTTILSALIVNAIRSYRSQRIIGLSIAVVLLFFWSLLSANVPLFIKSMIFMYIIKVSYSFPVDHFAEDSCTIIS
jgi:hypothetical protein